MSVCFNLLTSEIFDVVVVGDGWSGMRVLPTLHRMVLVK